MPTKPVFDQDIQSRINISSKLDNNFFVEASAGSGKTTSLVYRMVALVEAGKPVNKICTITFTKAAADEFFERFQKLLSIRSGDAPDKSGSDFYLGKRTEETKRRCREALNNIDTCFLGTMDAFCNTIAHELPSALKIPSNSEVISNEEYTRLCKEVFNSVLVDTKHPLHNLSVHFSDTFGNKSFDAFAAGLQLLNEYRNTKIDYDASILVNGFEKYFANDEKELLDILKTLTDPSIDSEDLFIKDITKIADSEKKRVKARNNLSSNLKRILSKNKPLDESEISSLAYILKDIAKMDGFTDKVEGTSIETYVVPPNKKGALYKFDQTFIDVIEGIKNDINEYKYSLFFEFVSKFMQEVVEYFKNLGKFKFFDFLIYLRDAFKDSVNNDPNHVLINHILERHEFFLIDESQDTNPLQTELFFYLTASKNDSNWRGVEPQEGKLFIVGDPKQSIYSFRGADVLAYVENKKVFENKNEVLVMTRNYRSNASLREWFNLTFDDMLNYQDPDIKHLALNHLNIPIEQNDVTRNIPNKQYIVDGVYKYNVYTNAKTKDADILEPESLAKLILDIKNTRKICVKKPKANYVAPNDEGPNIEDRFELAERDIEFGDFLIVPVGTDIDKYITAFNTYNIPFVAEAKTPYQDSETLTNIVDILYLLKEPYNPNNLIKVLEGPLFRLCDKDIIQMKNDGFELDISHIGGVVLKDSNQQSIITKLNALYNSTLHMGLSSALLYLLNSPILDITKYVSSEQLEYTFFIIEKIKAKEEDGSISTLRQLQDYIDDYSKIQGDEQRSLRFNKTVNKVKIANLHKVKGLEAPIVILANPAKQIRPITKFVDYLSNPPVSRFISLADSTDPHGNTNLVETKRFDSSIDLWTKIADTEIDRLAYVGATRARNVLIIFDADDLASNYQNPWAKLLTNVDRTFELSTSDINPAIKVKVDVNVSSTSIPNAAKQKSIVHRSPSETRKIVTFNDDVIDDLDSEDDATKEAALKGTIVHKLMELLVTYKNEDVTPLVDYIVEMYNAEQYRSMLLKVANTMLSGGYPQKNSSIDQDLLKTLMTAKSVQVEVPFSYKANNKNANNQDVVITGKIDLLYLDQNDQYHIIDYKTGDESDVSKLEVEYHEQLLDYYYALKKNGINADYHIYHIDLE